MNILSLDLSICETGVCKDGNTELIETSASEANFFRLDKIVTRIDEILQENSYDYVGIEQYAFNMRNTSTLTRLAELSGIVQYHLWKNNINPLMVSATQWKAMILGDSQIKKNRILLKTYKKFPKEFSSENDNEADAFCIYKFISLILEYFKNPDFEYDYHERIMHNVIFQLILETPTIEKRRIKNSKGKFKTKYFYEGNKVASFNGLSRYMDEKKIYKVAYDKFQEKYRVKN